MLGDVPGQLARVEALVRQGEPLLLADAAVIEAVFVLERAMGISRATVGEAIRAVLALKSIRTDRPGWEEILETWVAHPKLSVVDVYLAHRANAEGNGPLYTFDARMVRQLQGTAAPPLARGGGEAGAFPLGG
jgi:predicted nucleic-acid-binding protein